MVISWVFFANLKQFLVPGWHLLYLPAEITTLPVAEYEDEQGRAPGPDLLEAGVCHDIPGVLDHDHRHLDQ
mgnify:CR=1 FL=1